MFHYYDIYFNNKHGTIQIISQKSIFLKSGSMVAGLTKAFLGVGDNQKELSFSDHTHNLPDLNGILTANKGGTGVSSLDELKTALGISDTSSYYIAKPSREDGRFHDTTVPDGWVCYIAIGNELRVAFQDTSDTEKYYELSIRRSTSSSVATFSIDYYSYISNTISLNSDYTTIAVVFY